ARLAGVLLSGYYSSTVSGAGGAPQSDIGNAYCSKPVARCEPLDAEVLRRTGQHIAQFQGRYTGSRFTVGGF
ncbi:MAG TPA: hypothetical protein VFM56_13150, partial [Solimonas sp.]|nr:hypothetical protein [Solimonas sp.]